jgi:hypothetical protein
MNRRILARAPKLTWFCLPLNIDTLLIYYNVTLHQRNMATVAARKPRRCHFTPLPDLIRSSILKHPKDGWRKKAGLSRCTGIVSKEMDQNTFQGMYDWYTKRLHECQPAGGQMTCY